MTEAVVESLLTLSLTPGLGPTLTRRCLARFGSAGAVLGASAAELASVQGIGLRRAEELRRAIDSLSDGSAVARERELVQRCGATVLSIEDTGYPRLLRHTTDPPPLLFVRGELRDDDAVALAVVGARKCTHYGREQAERLAYQCAQAGLCIVSGGAYGIDAAAHRAAVRAGGRTVVVLGSGIARPYPQSNVELFDRVVAESRGAVVSELPMSTPPIAENFPPRNRIISGLSLGVLVVEAASRSGALITARVAAEEQGREVMAIPGKVDSPVSAGCHRAIREGWATLVTSAAEVLEALGETGALLKAGLTEAGPTGQTGGLFDSTPQEASSTVASLALRNVTESQRKIVDALSEPRELEQLVEATSLSAQQVMSDLTMLQIRGVVEKRGSVFVLKRGT